jgi:hypothetical protein
MSLYPLSLELFLFSILGSIFVLERDKKVCRVDLLIEEASFPPGSRDLHPFQAVAEAVNNAQSLRQLRLVLEGETLPKDPLGLAAFANALREHTALQVFSSFDVCSRVEAAPRDLPPTLWRGCDKVERRPVMRIYFIERTLRKIYID